jgi:hypothetical protein
MKDKKQIDKLFKDRFNNFEVSPPPEVWISIQTSLESRKKNRKIIPLFWKVGGVAALLALLFTINYSIDNSSAPNTRVVTIETPVNKKEGITKKSSLIKEDLDQSTKAFTKNSKIEIGAELKKHPSKMTPTTTSNPEKVKKESNRGIASNASSKKQPTNNIQGEGITAVYKELDLSNKIKKEILTPSDDIERTTKIEPGISENTKSTVASNQVEIVDKQNSDKKSILDAINEQKNNKIAGDIAQEKKASNNRWEVAPNFAPVYYNTLSEGSSLDPSFSDNTQNGDVNFSFGVQVSYAINDRLSIRSGISNVDLSYATGGVEIGTGPITSALSSINYDGTQNVLTVLDEGAIEAQNASNGGFGIITQKATNGPAEVIQSISYYEIPLELKYAIVKRKVGVHVIGGLSTMFLGNNDVTVKAGDFSAALGEVNNLSNISFTTNIGIGFDYKASKKIKFNVEPMFKYQLNPYADTSVDFQPYYIGVYTGLSYTF